MVCQRTSVRGSEHAFENVSPKTAPRVDCLLEQLPKTHTNAGKKGLRGLCRSPRISAVVWLFGKRQPTAGEREVRQTRRNRSGNKLQESGTSHLPCAAGHGDRSNPINGETAVATRILFRWPSGRNDSDACAARSHPSAPTGGAPGTPGSLRVFWRTVKLRLSPVALVGDCGLRPNPAGCTFPNRVAGADNPANSSLRNG